MIDEIEIEDFLVHHGVKGQKWGIRTKAFRGDFKARPLPQKLALVGGGAAGWVGARKIMNRILKQKAPISQLVIAGVSAKTGARMTRHFLDRNKNKKVSQLGNKP